MFLPATGFVVPPALPPMYAAATRRRLRRQERSPRITLSAYGDCGWFWQVNRLATLYALLQLGQGWALCDLADFGQQVVRERHACHGRTGLKSAMQSVGNIAHLYRA